MRLGSCMPRKATSPLFLGVAPSSQTPAQNHSLPRFGGGLPTGSGVGGRLRARPPTIHWPVDGRAIYSRESQRLYDEAPSQRLRLDKATPAYDTRVIPCMVAYGTSVRMHALITRFSRRSLLRRARGAAVSTTGAPRRRTSCTSSATCARRTRQPAAASGTTCRTTTTVQAPCAAGRVRTAAAWGAAVRLRSLKVRGTCCVTRAV